MVSDKGRAAAAGASARYGDDALERMEREQAERPPAPERASARRRREAALEAVCAEPGGWHAVIKTMSENPRLSPSNIAAVAAARRERGYESCLNLDSEEGWRRRGGTRRRSHAGDPGILLVREDGYASTTVWPVEAYEGVPEQGLRRLPRDADMMHPALLRRYATAIEDAGVPSLGQVARAVIGMRYGQPVEDPPVPDHWSAESLEAALSQACREASAAADRIDRALATPEAAPRPERGGGWHPRSEAEASGGGRAWPPDRTAPGRDDLARRLDRRKRAAQPVAQEEPAEEEARPLEVAPVLMPDEVRERLATIMKSKGGPGRAR